MHILFITGGLLVGVPILLHLIMRQEPKKLPFPAFRFLKMKRRINQRKMRLRHLLLLLLRMGLIALIAWVLFQPRWGSDYFNIKGEQPVACVLVIDTSPSMGYVLTVDRGGLAPGRKRGPALLGEDNPEDSKRPWTSLDEARLRALELLDELPPASRVAVIDSADREALWSLSLPDARRKIRDMKRTRASSRPISQVLPLAYQLFANIDEAALDQKDMPRLLGIFSDRTAPTWDASQGSFLKQMRKDLLKEEDRKVPFVATFLDVGVEKPLNLAITGLDMKPQLVPANKPVEFSVWLEATGTVQENTVQVFIDGEYKASLTQAVRVEPGAPKEVTFRREGLAPGLHQAEIGLLTPDALPNDDVRYLTFRVREPRNVLIVADALPALGSIAGSAGMAARMADITALWRISLESTAWYACEIKSTQEFLEMKPAQMGQFEAIVFAGLNAPATAVWDKASAYVDAGGKLVVVPAGAEMLADAAGRPLGYDNKLLPGSFKNWIDLDRTKPGVSWAWDALKAHGLLNDFRDWLKNPRIDFIANRPQVWGYWEVEPRDKLAIVVPYADDAEADKRRAAILERQVGQSGKVLLFTTPLDGRFDIGAGTAKARLRFNNDYAGTSFFLVLSNLALRYLTGDTEDAVFNFINGQNVFIKWPLDANARSKFYFLSGPDLTDKEAEIIRPENEAILRLGPERLKAAGNYDVRSDPADKKRDFKPWREGFSLNPPADESNLERVPIADIEEILGENSVVASDKERKLQDILGSKFGSPIELFPFLMILLLLFMAFENLLSNKFYKQQPPPQ